MLSQEKVAIGARTQLILPLKLLRGIMSESVEFVGAATASVVASMMGAINFMSMLWLCACTFAFSDGKLNVLLNFNITYRKRGNEEVIWILCLLLA